MTELQRIQSTYDKIKKAHPDVVSSRELTALAIREDKKKTLLKAFAWLAGGIICGALYLLGGGESDALSTIWFLMALSGVTEFFRTLGTYSRIETRYRPVIIPSYKGQLTPEYIRKKARRKLKNNGGRFALVTGILKDKNDDIDTTTDNSVFHTYDLIFEGGNVTVNRRAFIHAVLGAPYLLVMDTYHRDTPLSVVDAYALSDWGLSPELREFYRGDDFDRLLANAPVAGVDSKKKKQSMIMAIISLALAAVSTVSIVAVSLVLGIAALILAILALRRHVSVLSIVATVASTLLCGLLLLILVMA